MNKEDVKYIRIINFDEEANKIINKAIRFSIADNCEGVNSVHILLAILSDSKNGKNILDAINIDFDMLYDTYQMLASNGNYGFSDPKKDAYDLNNFDNGAYRVVTKACYEASQQHQLVTVTKLLETLIQDCDVFMSNFLDNVGLNPTDLLLVRDTYFEIPESLTNFVVDMNGEKEKNKELTSYTDEYTNKMIEILSRKNEANPCLIGEAGVGKSTTVRALVKRIISGNVPENLKGVHIVYVNSSMLNAGTMYRGSFEARMLALLNWASRPDIILFLDEMHTFINLGSGSNDSAETAGNMIKKYLSDGDIRIIGATTTKEYHKFIESDKAFKRRIQPLTIKEPKTDTAIKMLKDTISNYEKFHNVSVTDECIEKSVMLSDRYMKNEFLPAKAYKIIDQTCTVVKLDGRNETTLDDVYRTVSKLTGINVNKLSNSEAKQLLTLEDTIKKELVGQDKAVETVCKAIRRAKAGVSEENKPLASFMFVGPTGVGKTELCKVLSKEVALGDIPLIKVDMSEYSEKHSSSKMIGTAPGYVGYGEGGQLTEKVKNNPYSIILFDEIEKAHPDVFNVFLQLLDEGRMTDGEGTTVDFTNCIVVMTSNAGYGAEKLSSGTIGFGTVNDVENKDKEKIALEALRETFKPEFLNRLDNIVVFDALGKEQCENITKIMLNKLSDRLYNNSGIKVKFNKSVVKHITDVGYSEKYGARNIKRAIQNEIEDALADSIISGKYRSGDSVSMKYSKNNVELTKLA